MPVRLLLYVLGLEEGGAEKQLERLALGLNGSRFQTAVAYSKPWGIVGERLKQAGIPVLQFPRSDAAEAERVVRGFAPEIFHSFSHRNAVELEAAHGAGVPHVIASRVNMREWDPDLQVKDWEVLRNRVTERVTSVSHAVARLCTEVEGVGADHITVIHNGVELPGQVRRGSHLRAELEIPETAPVIGYAANYRPEKGHDSLLRAFRLVVYRRPDVRLVCCGILPPETQARLQAVVRDLNLESAVYLLPSRSDVGSIYRTLDLYVHPSHFEGFSNSLLEAMSYALPVVATRVGGTPEAVDENATGLLTPKDDPPALAAAILELLADPERARSFGQAGRERVTRLFTVEKMIDAYSRFYEETLARERPGPVRGPS